MTDPITEDLRSFLRTRRARVSPEQAGLPRSMGIRRVPGLRREEVALLAGVSAEYYERLERGRARRPSASVLDAVSRVLQLTPAERDHLFALASALNGTPPRPRTTPLRTGLSRTLDMVTDVPALILGPRHDLIAVNDLGAVFYAGLEDLASDHRNMVRYLFTVEVARTLYADWAATARTVVAELRAYSGTHPHDPQLAGLVGDLSVRDPDFRRWWAEHDVFVRDHGTKRYHHPIVGELELGYETLTPTGEPDLTFGTHTVEPGSASAHALALLASWNASQAPPRPGTVAPATPGAPTSD